MSPAYKYYINDAEVFPLNGEKQVYKYEPSEPNSVVFELNIDQEFIFKSNNSEFNFKTQQETNICEELEFRIEQRCAPGSYAILWEGIFAVGEGKFDDDKCLFSFKPRKKEFILSDVEVNILDFPGRVQGASVVGVVSDPSGGGNRREYANCIWLSDVLLFVAQKSNPQIVSVVSDFFQINPVNAFPFAFTNYWEFLAIAALSDIQEPIPSDAATIERVTFKSLMADLFALFSVQWFIDSNYNLRIEHTTFFDGTTGLNVTGSSYSNYMRGTNKTEYDIKGIVKEEIWSIIDHQEQVNIVYGGLANLNKEKNSFTYSTSKIRTDFVRIRGGGNNSTDEGLFLFATDGGVGSTGTEIWLQSSISVLLSTSSMFLNYENAALSPAVLVQSFHTYNRSSLSGLYTAVNRTLRSSSHSGGIVLQSMKPALKQVEFAVPICCAAFNPNDQVVTSIGNGYVDEAKYQAKTGMLSLKLKYRIDNCDVEPSDISGLQLWLKNNEGLTIVGGGPTGYISQWDDASGNGNHAVQGSTPATFCPEWTLSGSYYGALFSSGVGTRTPFLTTPTIGLFPSKRGTIFILTNSEGASAGNFAAIAVLSTYDGTVGNFFDIFISGSDQFFHSSIYGGAKYPDNGVYFDPPFNTSRSNYGLYVIRREADTSFYCRQDSLECIDNPFGAVPNTIPTVKPLIIGHNSNIISSSGSFMLAELIIYDRVLTSREIENVELYLSKKGIYKIVGS